MKQLLVLVILLNAAVHVNGQSAFSINENYLSGLKPKNSGFWLQNNETTEVELKNKNIIGDCFGPVRPFLSQVYYTNPLTISDYASTLGVICRQELKLDKITPMPVRFRLGSLEYVNWLERKPNAIYNR